MKALAERVMKNIRRQTRRHFSAEHTIRILLDGLRGEDSHVRLIDAMQRRLYLLPNAMGMRRRAVEHIFGALKSWMSSTHFLTKTLKNVRTDMSLCVLT